MEKNSETLFCLLFKLRKFGAALCTSSELSQGEMNLLTVLNAYDGTIRREELPVTELSRRLKTTQPAVTQLVNRLEKKGFIERVSDSKDRRIVRIKTTVQGTKLFKTEYEKAILSADEVINKLGPEKTAVLIGAIEDLLSLQ